MVWVSGGRSLSALSHTSEPNELPTTIKQWSAGVSSGLPQKANPQPSKEGGSSTTDVIQMETLPPPATQIAVKGKGKRVRMGARGPSVHWAAFKKQIGTVSSKVWSETESPNRSRNSSFSGREPTTKVNPGEPDEVVEEVVVDRLWDEDGNMTRPSSEYDAATRSAKESFPRASTDHETASRPGGASTAWSVPLVGRLRGVVWPMIVRFFSPRFENPKDELRYQHEQWIVGGKRLALVVSLFLIINWCMGIAFVQSPWVLLDQLWFWAAGPLLSFPVFVLVALNVPRKHPDMYSSYIACAVWGWSLYQIFSIHFCGFYGNKEYFSCGNKDFLTTFYYTNALQVVALFGLRIKRLPATVGALSFVVFAGALVVPYRSTWVRNLLQFIIFQVFLIWIHYMSEMAERKVYTMRISLKAQHKATQKAQNNEKLAADSKRRLTSYVFHEVRVPLNIAILAVQNMAANNAVTDSHDEEFSALQSSLNVMSKVLDDVLDFNRMDSGRFETVSRPYAFHQCMRSIITPLQLATNRNKLELIVDLDPRIDLVALRAASDAQGLPFVAPPPDTVADGVVSGDETRLRQVINNLVSNAVKFTPAGGTLTVCTKLIAPENIEEPGELGPIPNGDAAHELSMNNLTRHTFKPKPPLRWIVVRIEISDTGCGIRSSDMANNKLFSAFNQTEVGRQQGGKGTGLGLALVRTIVKLTGGRLGVTSKVGEGSTFWLEIPLGVGSKAMLPPTTFELREQLQATRLSESHSTTGVSTASTNAPLMRAAAATSQTPTPARTSEEATQRPPLANGAGSSTRTTVKMPPVERPNFLSLPAPFDAPPAMPPLGETTPTNKSAKVRRFSPIFSHLPVLVVDDDFLTRKMMQRMLTRLGCDVTLAENGLIALQLLMGGRQPLATPSSESESRGILDDAMNHQSVAEEDLDTSPFAIVFLDNQMPVMSGCQAIEKLRRERGEIDFVVGLTGNALITDQEEYLEAGVDHVLTKPVLEETLKSMLIRADERWKKQKVQAAASSS